MTFRGERRESQQGGRTVFTEPGRVIVVDPRRPSRSFAHNEEDRFRYGRRAISGTQQVGAENPHHRGFVPTAARSLRSTAAMAGLLRRIRRDETGPRNRHHRQQLSRSPARSAVFYVDLPPPGDPHSLRPLHRRPPTTRRRN